MTMSNRIYAQTAGQFNITINDNAAYGVTIQICTDDDGTIFFDLTDYTAQAWIVQTAGDLTPLMEFTCTINPTDAVDGYLTLSLTLAQAEELKSTLSGTGFYDVLLIGIDGEPIKKIEGTVKMCIGGTRTGT